MMREQTFWGPPPEFTTTTTPHHGTVTNVIYSSPPPPRPPTANGLAEPNDEDSIFRAIDAMPGPVLREFLKRLRARYRLDETPPPLIDR